MPRYALVETGVIKELVDNIPEVIHPQLKAMYKEIPENLQDSIGYDWVIKGDTFNPAPEIKPSLEDIKESIKASRNRLLAATDKYLLADYPITKAQLEEIKRYRQALRDVPSFISENTKSVDDIVFPENPVA